MKFYATYDAYEEAYWNITSENGYDSEKWVELNTKSTTTTILLLYLLLYFHL